MATKGTAGTDMRPSHQVKGSAWPFREVDLKGVAEGRLFLHSIPGRFEPLAESWEAVGRLGITIIVCLSPPEEMENKSPDYATAIAADEVPCDLRQLPVADFGAPASEEDFRTLAVDVGSHLQAGDRVLVHCGAGIGRTGMFAIAILMVQGFTSADAQQRVRRAGSGPERAVQEAALTQLARFLAASRE